MQSPMVNAHDNHAAFVKFSDRLAYLVIGNCLLLRSYARQ